jgi:hypothetical protein
MWTKLEGIVFTIIWFGIFVVGCVAVIWPRLRGMNSTLSKAIVASALFIGCIVIFFGIREWRVSDVLPIAILIILYLRISKDIRNKRTEE